MRLRQVHDMFKLSHWLKSHWDTVLAFVLIAYFAVRVVYFVFHIDHSIPPDEIRHLGRCNLYARSALLPSDSPDSHAFGLVAHTPYLYYFLMGKLLHLNAFPVSDLIFLRLVSAVFGVVTVLYGWRWVRLFSPNRLVHVLFLTMLTNTLMFTVMCSAVNYDSLTNLLAAMAIYYLTRFYKEQAAWTLSAFWVCILAGALTKKTFLPLAFILVLCLAVHERRKLMTFPRELYRYLIPVRSGRLAGVAVVMVLFALNLALYGGNLVRFRRLIPSAKQILSEEQIMQASGSARLLILSLYRKGELSFEQAMRRAQQIKLQSARRDTMLLLTRDARRKAAGYVFRPLSRLSYGFAWCQMMTAHALGLSAHRAIPKDEAALTPYILILLLATAMFIRHWRPTAPENFDTCAMVVVLFYVIVLMQFVNYRTYLKWEEIFLALQGRYLFPVLVPLYGLVAHYLLSYWPKPAQVAGLFAVGTVFIYGDFPFFLEHATPAFFFRHGAM